MKKIWTVIIAIMLVSCGNGTTKSEKSWNDVYAMIDSGEKQSVIDRTISELGPANHPASQTIMSYFDYFMTGEAERAWEYIEPNSPLSKEIGNVEAFKDRIQKALNENQYTSVTIKGLSLSTKNETGERFATVRFTISMLDKNVLKNYESIANYIVKCKNNEWLIYDLIRPSTEIK